MSCEAFQTDPTLPGVNRFNCLFVGKGPSITQVSANLGWGDLAVVNEAGDKLDARSAVTFIDGSRQPHNVSQNTGLIVSPQAFPKPVDAERVQAPLWQWSHYEELTSRAAIQAIRARESIYLSAPGPSGVIFLFLRGYRRIWLFGMDGGKDLGEGFSDTGTDYTHRRTVIESMVPVLEELGCEVKFWPEKFE